LLLLKLEQEWEQEQEWVQELDKEQLLFLDKDSKLEEEE
jgi:hypothetical protein